MSEANSVLCPTCQGKVLSLAFLQGPAVNGIGLIQCATCRGLGSLSAAQAARLTIGNCFRAERIARRLTVREEAVRLGLTFGEMLALEHGEWTESPALLTALEKRRREVPTTLPT